MRRDDYIDFHYVEPGHVDIHVRLTNWGRWCHPFYPPSVAAGFELYRSPARARDDSAGGEPVDGSDASKLHSLVQTLPLPQRAAVTWAYTKPVAPGRQARKQGVSIEQLHFLLRDSRQRLIDQCIAATKKLESA